MRTARKAFSVLGCLVLAALLSGCPYRSSVPLGPPQSLDQRLLGQWKEEDSSSATYEVTANGTIYSIVGRSEGDTTAYQGHLSSVHGKWYLNLRSEGEAAYSLFWLEFTDGGFTLHPVTENITEKFVTSAELADFVAKNQELSFFYEKPSRYVTASP